MKKLKELIEEKWQYHLLITLLLLAAATGIGYLFKSAGFPDTNIVLLYILAVLVTSCVTKGWVWGLAVSIAATLMFNFFFTAPFFTLKVNDPSHLITFIIMTIAALVTSTMTTKVKLSAYEAMEREKEMQELYKLTSHLTEARDADHVADTVMKSVSDRLDCHVSCLCFSEEGPIEDISFDRSEELAEWPIRGEHQVVGVIFIPKKEADLFDNSQNKFLSSLIECSALAMDRIIAVKQQTQNGGEKIKEESQSPNIHYEQWL